MTLKTDIKRAVQNNTNLKVYMVNFKKVPRSTPNGKYEVYTIEIYVKNK